MDALDQMRSFVRIVDAGSLSGAARGRGLSLAAVSRQLAALEDDLGATLIVRSTRRLQVTPSGRRWYGHCARLLRELDDARADVAETTEPRGTVVVSAPVTLGLAHVAPRLAQLARRHPHLEIDLRLEDQVVDLIGDAVDIAVRGGVAPPDSTSVIAHPVLEFRRVVVAAPSYLRRTGVPRRPADLAQHDGLIQIGPRGPLSRWQFTRGGETCEVTPRVRLRSTAPIVLREWAKQGTGIALISEWLIDGETRDLRRLFADWTTPAVHAWAVHRIELRGAPRIRATLAALAS